LAFGLLALGASLCHLGRPQFAFRAVLGLKHSWLSREIVAFGAFAGLAAVYSMAVVFQQFAAELLPAISHTTWVAWLGRSVGLSGVIAVFCSTMIYVFTQRECWSLTRTGVRFLLTSVLLGVGTLWLSMLVGMLVWPTESLVSVVREHGPNLCEAVILVSGIKLTWEGALFRHLLFRRMTPMQRSAILLTRELSNTMLARFALGVLGGILLPVFLRSEAAAISNTTGSVEFVTTAGLLVAACLAGEVLERYLFFAACAAPRMPGSLR
jgi:formate dehydrogenase iron-sulfur subunit